MRESVPKERSRGHAIVGHVIMGERNSVVMYRRYRRSVAKGCAERMWVVRIRLLAPCFSSFLFLLRPLHTSFRLLHAIALVKKYSLSHNTGTVQLKLLQRMRINGDLWEWESAWPLHSEELKGMKLAHCALVFFGKEFEESWWSDFAAVTNGSKRSRTRGWHSGCSRDTNYKDKLKPTEEKCLRQRSSKPRLWNGTPKDTTAKL